MSSGTRFASVKRQFEDRTDVVLTNIHNHTQTHSRTHTHANAIHSLAHARTHAHTHIHTHTDTVHTIHGVHTAHPHSNTHRSPSPQGGGGSYLVTGSLVIPKSPRVVPHSPQDRNLGGGGARSEREREHARARESAVSCRESAVSCLATLLHYPTATHCNTLEHAATNNITRHPDPPFSPEYHRGVVGAEGVGRGGVKTEEEAAEEVLPIDIKRQCRTISAPLPEAIQVQCMSVLQRGVVWCSALQCGAVRCIAVRWVAVWCTARHCQSCVAVCCSVL